MSDYAATWLGFALVVVAAIWAGSQERDRVYAQRSQDQNDKLQRDIAGTNGPI